MNTLMKRQKEVKRDMPLSLFGEIIIPFIYNQDGNSRFVKKKQKIMYLQQCYNQMITLG